MGRMMNSVCSGSSLSASCAKDFESVRAISKSQTEIHSLRFCRLLTDENIVVHTNTPTEAPARQQIRAEYRAHAGVNVPSV